MVIIWPIEIGMNKMANKRKNITEVEEFYIRNNPENLTADSLAFRMGISLNKVKEILSDEEAKKVEIAEETKKKEPTLIRQMMRGESDGNKKAKIAIMTPSASQIMDEANKNARQTLKHSSHQPHIAKSFPDV